LSALYDAFGHAEHPLTLREDSIPVIRGIAVMDKANPAWKDLIRAIQANGEIYVEVES
jgi:hypothetical protein